MAQTKKNSWFRLLYRLGFYTITIWAIGLAFFFIAMPSPPVHTTDSHLDVEALIVLTGGKGRLETAISVLNNHTDKRLLIAGVNPIVEQAELSALTGSEAALFDCCVDIDRLSQNTAANAQIGAKWVKEHKFNSVAIITADYHVRRSMLLFENALPDISISGYAVETNPDLSFLIREYNKYLFTVFQLAVGIPPNVRVATLQQSKKRLIKT